MSSKTLGSDENSMVILKQQDTPGVDFLQKVLNLSLAIYFVSEEWKMERVVSLLKTDKDISKG